MTEYSVEITTVSAIADSDYLDRLAEIVYDLPDLVDPLLGLNADGSISASFCVVGPNPLRAANDAVATFVNAVAQAGPLRGPTVDEIAHGTTTVAAALEEASAGTVDSFGISRVGEREKVYV